MILDQLFVLKYGLFALGFYWASMLICSLGAFLIWFSTKDRTYLYLGLFIFLMNIITPLGPTAAGPNFASKDEILHFQILVLFSLTTNNVFYKFLEHFYKLKGNPSTFNKLLQLPIYIGWGIFPFVLLYPSRLVYIILTINVLTLIFLVIWLFIKETLKDFSNFWMAFGNMFFQISVAIYLSNSVHYVYANLIYLVLIGGFIQGLFFVIASGIRFAKSRHNVERLSKIALLDSFFTTKDKDQGTGLGLSISKKIVEDLKGVLYINNDSAHTQFVIELPFK